MAGSGVTLYAVSAAGNKAIVGTIDWREDVYLPAQINDNVAQIMADIRAMANAIGTGWIEIGDADGVYTVTYVAANQFRFDGIDVTATYRVGMRVRVLAPTPGTLTGTITAVAFATHTVITVAWDRGGALSNELITAVQLGVGSGDTAGAALAGPLSYRNILGRNGGFEVWQRGTGGSASIGVIGGTSKYIADGWYLTANANQDTTTDQFTPLTSGSRYSLAITRNAGQTGVGQMLLEFPLDTDEVVAMRGSIVTLSMTMMKGTGFTPAASVVGVTLATGTGAVAAKVGGITGRVDVIAAVSNTLTGTATRFSITSSIIVPTNATQASLLVFWTPVGTAPAADYFVIDDVQLEIGSIATPFERRPFESELLACQRHFEKTFPYGTAPAQATGSFTGAIATQYGSGGGANGSWNFGIRKRVIPTITTYNPTQASNTFRDQSDSSNIAVTAGVLGERGTNFQSAGAVTTVLYGIGHATADAGI